MRIFSIHAFGRTKEEAKSNLEYKLLHEYPDEAYSTSEFKIFEYGDEKSDYKYRAEYYFF
jgi:hypothetical protein